MRVERIGLATLYLGDCREVLPEIMVKADTTVITDPPYSSGGFQEAGKSGGSIGTRTDEVIALDNLSTRGYQRLMREVLRHLNIADEAYIFTDWRMWVYTADALEDGGWRVRNMLVWDKQQMGMGLPWRNQHELVAFGKRTPAKMKDGKAGNVLTVPRSGNANHPTEKPVLLIERLVANSNGAMVIDPFMGSGTTGVASLSQGVPFIGVEMDVKHFDTACRRMAALEAQGKMFEPARAEQHGLAL